MKDSHSRINFQVCTTPHVHSILHGVQVDQTLLQVLPKIKQGLQPAGYRNSRELRGEEAIGGSQPQRAAGLRARQARPDHRCRRPSALLAPTGSGGRAITAVTGSWFLVPAPHCCSLGTPLELLDHQQRYVRHCSPASLNTQAHSNPTLSPSSSLLSISDESRASSGLLLYPADW